MIFKESFRQFLAVSLVGLLTRGVVLVTVTTNAGRVAGGANLVRVNAGVELVSKLGVVRTGGVAAVSGTVAASETRACSAVRASEVRAGGAVGVRAVGIMRAGQTATCGSVCTCGTVLPSTDAASTSGVASCAITVRVDTRVRLIGSVRAVGASGVVWEMLVSNSLERSEQGRLTVCGARKTGASVCTSGVSTGGA